MRLIECDRCGVKGKLVPGTIFGTKGEGFGSLHPDGDAPTVELCPACVERALEKPSADSEKDMGGCCHAHVDDEDHTPIVLDSAHADRDSG